MTSIVVYYSRTGENYWEGGIRSIEKGNTERVAEFIAEVTGADLFELQTVRAYSPDYMTCIEEAKAELREKARPELSGWPQSFDAYDTVFVGYPNWWGTAPMCVFTFLEGAELADKRVVPFCTSEGSGLGSSVRQIQQACPKAKVEAGLAIIGSQAADSRDEVVRWAMQYA